MTPRFVALWKMPALTSSTKTAAARASAFAGVSAPSSPNNFGGRVGDDARVEGRERTGKIEVARQSPLDVQNEANLALVHAYKDRSE